MKSSDFKIIILSTSLGFTVACSHNAASSEETNQDSASTESVLHADRDIAMTLRSLMDAVNVGQPLDSVEYDFQGTLTDGSGRPLYTDLQGTPGTWMVHVSSDTSAFIRNLYLGDILPEPLEQYITQTLGIPESAHLDSSLFNSDPEEYISVYDFGTGLLQFSTRPATAPNGKEGPVVNIGVIKKPSGNRADLHTPDF